MPKYATEYMKDGKKFGDTIVAVDEASAKLVCAGRKRGEVIVGVVDEDATSQANAPLEAGSTEHEALGAPLTIDALQEMTEDEAVSATTGVMMHPDGYNGPCGCDLCLSYSAEDGDVDVND